MLVTVEIAGGAAQGVVLEDDAEIRARGALLVTAHEGRLQACYARLHVEIVRPEVVGEDLHRALLLVAHFGVARDVVGHREELLVHERSGARDHRVAAGIASREPRDELGQGERALELVHAADDVRGGGFFGRRLLGGGGGGDGGEQREGREVKRDAHRVASD